MPVYTLQAPSDVLAVEYVNVQFSVGSSILQTCFYRSLKISECWVLLE